MDADSVTTKDHLIRQETGKPWFYKICQILDISDSWKILMTHIPKEGSPNSYRFTHEHVKELEKRIPIRQLGGTEILLYEWGTMGKVQPNCGDLFEILVKAELFRAADYLAEVLKIDPPARPKSGPAAIVNVSELLADNFICKKEINFKGNVLNHRKNYNRYYNGQVHDKNYDMHKVSTSDNKQVQEITEQMSDLMKFSSESEGMNEAASADLPLILQEDSFESETSNNSAYLPLIIKEDQPSQSKPSNNTDNSFMQTESMISSETSIVNNSITPNLETLDNEDDDFVIYDNIPTFIQEENDLLDK